MDMNGNQQLKAVDYALLFLSEEIKALDELSNRISEDENKDYSMRIIEQRRKELQKDYDMFIEMTN